MHTDQHHSQGTSVRQNAHSDVKLAIKISYKNTFIIFSYYYYYIELK